jgi:hypothetical protein
MVVVKIESIVLVCESTTAQKETCFGLRVRQGLKVRNPPSSAGQSRNTENSIGSGAGLSRMWGGRTPDIDGNAPRQAR